MLVNDSTKQEASMDAAEAAPSQSEDTQSSLPYLITPADETEKKMPRGRRPKAVPPPKKFERQEALKNRIVGLSEELAENGFNDVLTPLTPIKPVAPEVVDCRFAAQHRPVIIDDAEPSG